MSTDNMIKKEESASPELPTSPARTRTTMSAKADIIFPVARVDRLLRDGQYSKRYSRTASVYLASVLEYLSAAIIGKAGEETRADDRRIISPKYLSKGIKNNEALNLLLSGGSYSIQIADAVDVKSRVPAKPE